MSNMAANGNIQKKIFAIEMLSNSNKGTFYIDESEMNEIDYVNDNESTIIDMSYCISRSGEITFWICDIKGVSISVFKTQTQIYDINKIWFCTRLSSTTLFIEAPAQEGQVIIDSTSVYLNSLGNKCLVI